MNLLPVSLSRALRAGIVALLAATPALADQVKLKNGDVLTGTIASIDGGKLVLKTAAAGDLTIDLAQVDSFATDNPAKVEVKKGEATEVVEGKVAMASGGNISVQAAGGAQTVALASVASINKPPFKAEWSGSIVGSTEFSRGNTYSESTSVDFNAIRRGLNDRVTLTGWYRASRNKDATTGVTSTTQRQSGGGAKYDYFLSKKVYAFAMAGAEQDAIAKIQLRYTAGAGAGWQVIEEADAKFNVEAGINYLVEEYTDNQPNSSGAAARLAYHYDRIIFKKYETSFFNDASAYKILNNSNDYLCHFKAGFREKLTESFFAQEWVDFTWDSTPAAGAKREDVIYFLGIGWTF
jgi:putative salt-induced outer membrane protein YdiY